MEAKLVRVAFDWELARKIKNGDVKGRIINHNGETVELDLWSGDRPDLLLEVPEYLQYKRGDIVVGKYGTPFIYNGIINQYGHFGSYCGIEPDGNVVPYSCTDWSSTITGYANEEQRKQLYDALKSEGSYVARIRIEQFFKSEEDGFIE